MNAERNGSLSEDDGGEMLDGTYNPCEIVEVTTKSQPGSDYLLSEVFNLRVGREVFQRSVDEEWYITEADIKDFLKEHVGNESLQDFAGPDDLIQYFLALYDLVMENEDLDVECRERHEDREKRKRLKNLSRFMKKYKGPHRTLSLS